MNHDEQTVERVAGELARHTYYHVSTTCECGHDFGHTRATDTEMQWHVARAALSAIPRPTESDVATAVYRHFTTPSREQVMRTLDASDPEGGNTNEDGIEFWGEQADAILALFEQNGANHE